MKNNIIEDWLDEHGNPEIDKNVEKQLEIEEAAENYAKGWASNSDKEAFIDGAKYQAERMYSEEEVLKAQQAILGNIKDALQDKNYIIDYLKKK